MEVSREWSLNQLKPVAPLSTGRAAKPTLSQAILNTVLFFKTTYTLHTFWSESSFLVRHLEGHFCVNSLEPALGFFCAFALLLPHCSVLGRCPSTDLDAPEGPGLERGRIKCPESGWGSLDAGVWPGREAVLFFTWGVLKNIQMLKHEVCERKTFG